MLEITRNWNVDIFIHPGPKVELKPKAESQAKITPHKNNLLLFANDWAEKKKPLKAAEETIQIMAPKVEVYNAIAAATNLQTVPEVAKVYGVGPNKLFESMRQHGILMWNNLPYQRWINKGYFKPRKRTWEHPKTGEDQVSTRTMVTGAGVIWLEKRLARELDALRVEPKKDNRQAPAPQVEAGVTEQPTFGL